MVWRKIDYYSGVLVVCCMPLVFARWKQTKNYFWIAYSGNLSVCVVTVV